MDPTPNNNQASLSIEDQTIMNFMRNAQLLHQSFGVQVMTNQSQVLKMVALDMPSHPDEKEAVKKQLRKCQELLLNEYLISQEICQFKCIHNGISEQTQQIEGEEVNSQHLDSELTCSCIQGMQHLLLPSSFLLKKQWCGLVSPYANKKDAFSHLIISNQGIFQQIQNSFEDIEILDVDQKNLLVKARFILFGTMKVASQIGAALYHLHENLNIAHNDLKADNYFAHEGTHPLIPYSNQLFRSDQSDDDDQVSYYLSDFGFAKKVGFQSSAEAQKFFSLKEKRILAPEILDLLEGAQINCQTFEKTADIYSFGVSLFQILFQVNPLFNKNDQTLIWEIVQKQLQVYSNMTEVDSMMNLIEGMLQRDPAKRFTIQQVISHPWLSAIQEYYQN